MTGKTHQVLGITIGTGYFLASQPPTYEPATFGAVLVFSYLAALLPDIDQPAGKFWHFLPFGHTLGKISDPFLEHRNITHSILGAAIVCTGLYFLFRTFPPYWGIDTYLVTVAAMASYLSHIFVDMFTNEGVPLLFPWHHFFGLPPKPFDGFRIAAGKWFENLVVFPIINIVLIIFVISNWSKLHSILFK